ncbi:hypothetical protein ACFV06_00755 [Streptomyces sp. NPDC059618]|uniref:hypothetical protein n=1 Tax=Streptomyces sp. NPDC059618 TaxID=3346887 RepID=UPI0036802379
MTVIVPPRLGDTGVLETPARVVVLIVILLTAVLLAADGQDPRAAAGVAVIAAGASAEIADRLLGVTHRPAPNGIR